MRRWSWLLLGLLACKSLACEGRETTPEESERPRSKSTAPKRPSSAKADTKPSAAPTEPSAAPTEPSAAPARALAPSEYKLDGIALGTNYGRDVMSRAPYERPCDDDAIDRKSRRFMVYGAKECRHESFPEGTTVAFYLHFSESDRFEDPIEAIAWLGGTYFETRSNFPLKVGEPADAAVAALGAIEKTFEVTGSDRKMTVRRHPGPVFSLVDGSLLCGFVVGAMPDDPENEQWEGLLQMYDRYTDPPRPR